MTTAGPPYPRKLICRRCLSEWSGTEIKRPEPGGNCPKCDGEGTVEAR